MPDSTSSQSPQDSFVTSNGTDQWNRMNNTNIIQNGTGLEWNAVPNQNVIPVHSNMTNQNFISNGNETIQYNTAPNYITTIQYPRHVANMQSSYPLNMPNAQGMTPMPAMVRTPQRGPTHPNTWASQQNLKLIQTAWNKTTKGCVKKQKRIRTAFTSHQMMQLEQEYARTRYLDRTRRIELADLLRLNERTIKIWFQNRRMKEKKDRTENHEEVEDVSTTQPPSDLATPILVHNQYQPNSEACNRMDMFIEHPVSSTSAPMVPIPQGQMMGSYPNYGAPEGCPPPYPQVHFHVQYPSPYSVVHELSPESTPQSESSLSRDNSAQSETAEKSWDLSWIRSIEAEDEC